ncbi:hypothetical protein [Paracoccus sp. (in: a-proteobacteria)]|uniref:hypothetical protein n=1 Tax=Paracoccus sp. TaxID=267 RepID=UPI0028ABCD80|nr:hypothetical protein [Paracoccus sp. (in: a-proteobacteria)]
MVDAHHAGTSSLLRILKALRTSDELAIGMLSLSMISPIRLTCSALDCLSTGSAPSSSRCLPISGGKFTAAMGDVLPSDLSHLIAEFEPARNALYARWSRQKAQQKVKARVGE